MTQPDFEAYAKAAAAALSFPIAPAHLPGIVATLQVAAGAAALIGRVPLTLEDEPAPIFRASP
ncbi:MULTISPECIES: AtzG-like protein [Roseomonadaceae]|uniref:DUF4089 domain-containing protein n=1 Tax=Falsiroseomonas oleicola TaxID=2801474 RepID=A0ABS6HD94_9PROT|nr:AtzG-like protein [Roseomonas oleicola]MBU8545938.1 DUF4089 domain-containing protein [Roseomonas oleicola]